MNLGFVTAAQQGIEKAKNLGATANTIKSDNRFITFRRIKSNRITIR